MLRIWHITALHGAERSVVVVNQAVIAASGV